MTLGEGKRKVLMLLDEFSAGGQITKDEDIDKKMADFFDMAQKDMAGHKRIIRSVEIVPDGSGRGYALPDDFQQMFRVWRGGRLDSCFAVVAGKLMTRAGDDVVLLVEYYARPETIGPDTPDEHEFEVDEEAANCLPYFVAAQHLIPDLVLDYSAFMNMYLTMKAALDVSLPEAGGGRVRQALFRAGR
jgi:hypothetical protein